MHAAVVELDPLADPVRARADDHDPRLLGGRQRLVLLAPGRVVVVRARLDLARAGVDATVGGPDPLRVAHLPHVVAARAPRRADRVVAPAGPLRPQDVARGELAARMGELLLEPRMDALGDVVERPPRGRRAGVELARAERLQERLGERPADSHRLADRLHLRAERRVGAGELLEREARELDDDVVERGLEARRRRLREVVRDLVERVADRELRRDLRNWIARCLRGERGRPRDARVHLDHPDLAGLAAARELDVRAARLDADGADDRGRGIAELLVGLVGERHLRRHRDRVAGVDAHRVEVLDRADDDDVVVQVADHLELELVPAANGLLHEHLGDRALAETALDRGTELGLGLGEAAAVAAEREGGTDDGGRRDLAELVERRHDLRARGQEAAALDRVAELARGPRRGGSRRAARRSARRRARRGRPPGRARSRD